MQVLYNIQSSAEGSARDWRIALCARHQLFTFGEHVLACSASHLRDSTACVRQKMLDICAGHDLPDIAEHAYEQTVCAPDNGATQAEQAAPPSLPDSVEPTETNAVPADEGSDCSDEPLSSTVEAVSCVGPGTIASGADAGSKDVSHDEWSRADRKMEVRLWRGLPRLAKLAAALTVYCATQLVCDLRSALNARRQLQSPAQH